MIPDLVIENVGQLEQFLNDNNVLEIIVRDKKKKYKKFVNIAINDLQKCESQEIVQKAVDALNKNAKLNEKYIKAIGNIGKLQNIGLLLNGLNLCATCVGFAIMYAKLDKMSEEITKEIHHVENVVKTEHDIQTNYEFNKVLSNHQNMLDRKRIQKPYSEEQLRELVDQEYNVLTMLIKVAQLDASADNENLIFSIFSLLSMLTVSLREFDEVYYLNNHEVLEGDDVWHSAHEKWMSVYSTLSDTWFVEKLQDHAMFEENLSTSAVDAYYISLLSQVNESKQEVEDNQKLILKIGDIEMLHKLRNYTNHEVLSSIEESFNEVTYSDPEAVKNIYDSAIKQVGLA